MTPDDAEAFATRYRALASRDARFDGQFIVGVHSTGIYCRPSCPAMTPKPGNVSFYRTAAAAHEAGLRACKRCQPDAVPGSPDWNLRDDLAARAMRLIHDGVVDRNGVAGLAHRLGYSARHLTRVLTAELGAGPLSLARAHRAQTARTLLAVTELPIADIAFAAGFGSLRQFNETIAEIYRATPGELRALSRRGTRSPAAPDAGELRLRLPARGPIDREGLLRFFVDHAIPGLEDADGAHFARTIGLPGGPAHIRIEADPEGTGFLCRIRLARLADVGTAVARIRRALDLDADADAIDASLSRDPALAPLVAAVPGIRIAGSFDTAEALFRTLIGQQISVASARTVLGRLVANLGDGGFPDAATIAERGREVLRGPTARIDAIVQAAEALADGRLRLDIGMPVAEFRAGLLAQPGIGPWTADYLAMRALGSPDVLPVDDLVIRQSAAARGLPASRGGLAASAREWSPWRSYAALHLWRARPAREVAPRVR
ncbi:Ada metal-binding domain-containing protein [Homoserinibacter sp. GY 40078]|uniref:Ada metal-binding domain-containing protein n=1 Tax=Homoserinibacter sp. GY 40078 TaxID=2603275 RepID=UPI0011CC461B|nr:Ada metal-binding domain-containing protein [Homoserinibacter sp. GY 40078]TXK17351.1 DNA-3-methyladenine glycosylase 2 family protein [Homoserinibacter sp. GY 40078]